MEVTDTIGNLAKGSRVIWYRDDVTKLIKEMTGIDHKQFERQDPVLFHFAFKAKLHRIIPESGYKTNFTLTDDDPIDKETHYRVRIEQRNGQRAWSSPIWIQPPAE
jgi:hypothetical protein